MPRRHRPGTEEVAQVKGAVRRMADARTTPATSECAAAVERRAAMTLAALEKAAPARAAAAGSPASGETESDALPPLQDEPYMPIRAEWSREDTVPGILRRPGTPIREQLASQSFPSAAAEPSVTQGKLSPLPSATARAPDPALGNIVSNANYRQGVRFRGGGRRPRSAASGRGRSEPAAAKAVRNRATMSHRALRRPADWASTPMAGGPARLAK